MPYECSVLSDPVVLGHLDPLLRADLCVVLDPVGGLLERGIPEVLQPLVQAGVEGEGRGRALPLPPAGCVGGDAVEVG